MHYLFRNIAHGKAKNGNQINTRVHYEYISREGKYAHMSNREEDLVFTQSGNMPDWAETPKDFWQACEENKPAKARGYREFLLGLQEELSLEDNIDCIEKLLEKTGIKDNHAYTYAVHDKTAAFDKEHRNIHCHLMFNEKIIEKDRPLGPELYFRRYSVNRDGELSGGYKISRDYQSKTDIMQLRKTWADIVNDKFAEKHLTNCHIDERTLKAQHDELVEQGNVEAAALINRTPAPHLGNAYLNPHVMERIKDTVKEVEEKHDKGEEVEVPEAIDETEKNILLFAKDFLLRKLAKELQKERQEEFALRAEQINKEYSDKDMQSAKAAAYVITNTDLSEQVAELVESETQSVDSYKEKLEIYDKKMLSKKKIAQQAYELLFNNEYGSTNAAYAKLREKITALSAAKKAFDNAVINKQEYDRDEYVATLKELNAAYTTQRELGKKIADFKAAIATESWQQKKAKVIAALNKRNKAYYLERRKTYGLMLSAKKKLDRYTKLKTGLDALPPGTIIYADKIPRMVNKYTMIDGVTPVSSLKKYKYDNQTYCVLGTEIKDGRKIFKAVRLYDDVIKGKATIYELSLEKPVKASEYHFYDEIATTDKAFDFKNEPSKPIEYIFPGNDVLPANTSVTSNYDLGKKSNISKADALQVTHVEKTDETICTYAKANSNKAKSGITKASTTKPVYHQRYQDKANELIAKLTETKEINIPVYWKDDAKKPIDELQRTEMQMYAGWSL